MYQGYFGLTEAPFSIAPDPRYLYMSQRHQEALAHLLYGVSGDGGFVLLTGEVGTGKTTICRCLLEQVPESCDVAYIFNPKLTVEELLSTLCVEFGIAYPAGNTSIKVFVDCINAYLLDAHARGRHTVLIIDEAQNLSADVLEQMRLLTNLETNQRKLLQIILLGQPELAVMLERPELRQLAQRIVARYHLGPLTKPEAAAYIRHRLEVSGTRQPLFPTGLLGRVHRLSGGVPRVINVLCDRALLGAYTQGKERIDRATLAQAAREVFHRPRPQYRNTLFVSVVFIVLVGAALAVYRAVPTLAVVATRTNPAAQAAAAEPAAVLPITLEWPANVPRSRSRALAFAALSRAWGGDYQGAESCRQAEGKGLRCKTARGGPEELRQMNRPALLLMRDRNGQEFYVALTALDNKSATFGVGAESRTVAQEVLARQWTGNYTVMWRLPPGGRENIWPGERGAPVEWLSKQLAQVQGRPADATPSAVFDDTVVRDVRQFQLARGLAPDGIAGPQTLMYLSGVTDPTAPQLIRKQAEK
jgi:general secretion pathway protein A